MGVFQKNIDSVIAPLVEKIQLALTKKLGAKIDGKEPCDQTLKKIYEAYSELKRLGADSRFAEAPCSQVPQTTLPESCILFNNNLWELSLSEMLEFNRNGAEYVNSVSETVIKCFGIGKYLVGINGTDRMYFRGECRSDWKLVPRIFRKGVTPDSSNLLSVSQKEIELLRNFIGRAKVEDRLKEEIEEYGPLPADTDPEWWGLMQHYDELHGTRMIDLTTSVFSALYFACADWDGTIDESVDGALHFLPGSAWRRESETPGKPVDDSEDILRENVNNYFTLEKYPEIVRFRKGSTRNARLLAQDGFFVWWTDFGKELQLANHFKLIVCRDRKKHILKELRSIGYTAERIVRGEKGKAAQLKIDANIGLA